MVKLLQSFLPFCVQNSALGSLCFAVLSYIKMWLKVIQLLERENI